MSINTYTEIGMVDTRSTPKTLTMPLTTEILSRILTIKDIYGSAITSPITLNTQGADTFEDGSTSLTLSNSYDTVTFYAGLPGIWSILGGSHLAAASINTLSTGLVNVSTINVSGLLNMGGNNVSSVNSIGISRIISGTLTPLGIVGTDSLSNLTISATNTIRLTSPTEWRYITSNVAGATLDLTASSSYFATTYRLTGSPTITVTLPALTSGAWWSFINAYTEAQTITFAGTTTGLTNPYTLLQGASIIIYSDGTSYYVMTAGSPFTGSTIYISANTVQAQFVSTLQFSVSSINGAAPWQLSYLTSTIEGLANTGYISTSQLYSTVLGIGSGFTGSTNSLSAGSIFVSSINGAAPWQLSYLTSTTQGLATAGYISTSQLYSTVQGLTSNISSMIDPTELTSTITGLGTIGFISTVGLTYAIASTAQGLGTFGYTSTNQLLSTTLGIYNAIGTSITSAVEPQFTSTVQGLGNAGYISSAQLTSTVQGLSINILAPSSISTTYITSLQGFISSLTVNALAIGSNVGFVSMGGLIATSISTIEFQAGQVTIQQATISSINGAAPWQLQNNTSTVDGLGTVGYISTSQLYSTVLGIGSAFTGSTNSLSAGSIFISSINGAAPWQLSYLTSTIEGLANSGYISTSQLTSTVLGIGAGFTGSTISLSAGTIFVSSINGAAPWQLSYLTSTTQGLATAGYISTSQLYSTVLGIGSGFTGSTNSLSAGSIFVSSINGAAPWQLSYLTSTTQGLATSGYISTSQLYSTVLGLTSNISSMIDPTELTSTITGLGTIGFVSTVGLTYAIASTAQGLGTFGYTSTNQLLSTTLGIYNAIGTSITAAVEPQFTSTVQGLGNTGYISSTQLTSTVQGLNINILAPSSISTSYITSLQGFISSLTVNALAIGSNVGFVSMGDLIATSISTIGLQAGQVTIQQATISSINGAAPWQLQNNTSTVEGLGTAGYISTSQLTSTVLGIGSGTGSAFTGSTNSLSAGTIFVSSINGAAPWQLSYLTSTTQGLATAGYISTSQLTSTVLGIGSGFTGSTNSLSAGTIFVSSINGAAPWQLSYLTSTTQGLANTGYISSSQLYSTVLGIGSGFTGSTNSLSAGSIFVSSINGAAPWQLSYLTSTTQGLATAGYISTSQLYSTVQGLTSNISSMIDPTELTSTITGLGTIGFVSTIGLTYAIASTAQGLGTFGYTSTNQLLSTTLGIYTAIGTSITAAVEPQFTSTVQGLGLSGYISSTQLTSTVQGLSINILAPSSISTNYITSLQGFISSLTVNALAIGSNVGFVSMGDLITTSISTIGFQAGQVTIQQATISSINGAAPWQLQNNTSTVEGLGTAGYISTSQLTSTVLGIGLGTGSAFTGSTNSLSAGTIFVSSINGAAPWQLSYLTSTTQGLATAGYISTSQLTSTVLGIGSAFTGSTNSLSAGSIFVSSINGAAPWQLSYLTSTTQGLANTGYISTSQLYSTVLGIGSGFTGSTNSLSAGSIFVSSINGAAPWQLSYLTSTTQGLATAGYISTSQLYSTVLGLTSNISSMIDPTELTSTITGLGTIGFVSTVGLTYAIASTAQGLGTFGYTSTNQLLSTTLGIYTAIGTSINSAVQPQFTSTVQGLGSSGYLSSLVNVVLVSTLALNASSINAFNGFVSSLTVNSLIFGNNTGYINFGDIVPTSLSTITLNSGSALLSQAIISSINGAAPWQLQNNTSTIEGLGTAGYISTSQLISTVQGLNTYILNNSGSGGLTSANLTSTTQGLGLIGYISSTQLTSTVQGLTQNLSQLGYISTSQLTSTVLGIGSGFTGSTTSLSAATIFVSSINGAAPWQLSYLTSTTQGLATSGYISTSQLYSTVQGLTSNISSMIDPTELTSTITGLGTIGFVSTVGLTYAIASTAQGLGTFGYTSTNQLLSTTLGIYTAIGTSITTTVQPQFTSTVQGLGNTGYISSLANVSFISTLTLNVSSINGAAPWQAAYLTSTVLGLTSNISSMVDPTELTSTITGLGTIGFISTGSLTYAIRSTAQGLGTFGYISTNQLLSTTLGIYSVIGTSIISTVTTLIGATRINVVDI